MLEERLKVKLQISKGAELFEERLRTSLCRRSGQRFRCELVTGELAHLSTLTIMIGEGGGGSLKLRI